MAEWGDVSWSAATPEYRTAQFVLLVKELVSRDELEDATTSLVKQERDVSEELYDAVDEALAADDEAGDEAEIEEADEEN